MLHEGLQKLGLELLVKDKVMFRWNKETERGMKFWTGGVRYFFFLFYLFFFLKLRIHTDLNALYIELYS